MTPPTSAPRTAPATATTPPQGWVGYRDPSGLTLQHPATWTTQPSQLGPVFIFIDPRADDGGFRRNINILSQPMPAGFTDREYLRISMEQVATAGGTMDDNRVATLGGLAGHQVTWHFRKSGKTLRFLSLWTLRSRAAFIVTYSSDDTNFDAPLADVQQLIASIRLPPSA